MLCNVNTMTLTEQKPKKPLDEATLKRLAEMRKKSIETRRMRAELKKATKEEEKESLKKAYEEKILKKKPTQSKPETHDEPIDETEEEIYENSNYAVSDAESEAEVSKPKSRAKPKPKMAANKTEPNWKQEYYRMKMQRLQQQEEQSKFVNSYATMPPQVHVADIARQQLSQKVNKELYDRVFNDLFRC